jgi:hypothetical protein
VAAASCFTLADGTEYGDKGRVGPIERAVDPATGTLGVQLIFPNPQFLLRPGQYGRVRVLLDTKREAMLIPQRAVQELQNLHSVAVVDTENRVSFRNVSVGPARRHAVGDRRGAEAGRPGRRRRPAGVARRRHRPHQAAGAVGCHAGGRSRERGEVADVTFLRQPSIVAMVMSIIIVMLGVVAMKGLPIAQYPTSCRR